MNLDGLIDHALSLPDPRHVVSAELRESACTSRFRLVLEARRTGCRPRGIALPSSGTRDSLPIVEPRKELLVVRARNTA